MTDYETEFKQVMRGMIFEGVYPSPMALNTYFHRHGRMRRRDFNMLNGRECRWRDEVFVMLPDDHWVIVQHRKFRGCSNEFKREILAKRAKTKGN